MTRFDREVIPIDLQLETENLAQWSVLRVSGDVDLFSAPQLRSAVYEMIESGQSQIGIDLSRVAFLDSTGLGVLVGALKRVKEQNGSMVLLSPQKSVRRVLNVTGLDRIFTVEDQLDEDGVARKVGAESVIDAAPS